MTDSIYNTFTDIDNTTSTDRWDDVKTYTTVIQTLQGPLNAEITLNWGTGDGENTPQNVTEDTIADDTYDVSINDGEALTRQFDVRTRWLNVGINAGTYSTDSRLVTSYKRTPTEIKFKDEEDNALVYRHEADDSVLISETNSLKVGLTGATGDLVDSTLNDRDTCGNSLYVHFADGNADSLDTVTTTEGLALAVGLHDSSNVAICATGEAGETVIEDVTFFPKTDLVIAVDRSYSMNGQDIDSTSRYRIVFNSLLPTIMTYLYNNNAFAVDGRTRVVMFTYARPEIMSDISAEHLDRSIEHDSALHEQIEQAFDISIDNVNEPYRTIIPGALEIDSDDYSNIVSIITDFSNNVIDTNSKVIAGDATMDGSGSNATDHNNVMMNHHDLTPDNDVLSSAFSDTNYPPMAPLHPATAIYAALDRVIATDSYDASGAGNNGRWVDLLTEDGGAGPVTTNTYTPYTSETDPSIATIANTAGRQRILINICDGGITDDYYHTNQATGNNARYVYKTGEEALAQRINDSAHAKIKEAFGDSVYVFNIRDYPTTGDLSANDNVVKKKTLRFVSATSGGYTYTNPTTGVTTTLDNTQLEALSTTELEEVFTADSRIFDFSDETDRSAAVLETRLESMLGSIFDEIFTGHHAMKIAVSEKEGNLQAGTEPVEQAFFPGGALYYALADGIGNQITTVETSLNFGDAPVALHVHLTDGDGGSIVQGNELHIEYAERVEAEVFPFQLEVSGAMRSIADPDLRDTEFKLHKLGVGNEMPATMWLKVYDISTGLKDEPVADISDSIVYNIPVPGNSYRDIKLSSGVVFNNGIHFRISDDYPLDVAIGDYGTGQLFIDGAYSVV